MTHYALDITPDTVFGAKKTPVLMQLLRMVQRMGHRTYPRDSGCLYLFGHPHVFFITVTEDCVPFPSNYEVHGEPLPVPSSHIRLLPLAPENPEDRLLQDLAKEQGYLEERPYGTALPEPSRIIFVNESRTCPEKKVFTGPREGCVATSLARLLRYEGKPPMSQRVPLERPYVSTLECPQQIPQT